jgi:nicotinamidase-related amidase
VDVQRGFVTGEDALPDADALVAACRLALGAARAAGALVVHVQDIGEPASSVAPGGPGRELVLDVAEGEVVLPKDHDDAFAGTGLDDLLRGRGVTSVVVVGLQSEMCVAATARGALARGLHVTLPRDGHATWPVPGVGADDPEVPAGMVARVAEWSLGDEVYVVRSVADVELVPPPA